MKEVLVIDLETTSPDSKDATIKVFGAYDPVDNKYFIYKWTDFYLAKVVELLTTYKLIITFNGLKYDLPILERHGVSAKDFKHIDVRDVMKNKRATLLPGFASYSLKNLIKDLQLDDDGKGEIDYEVFKLDAWTPAQQASIVKYLKQDLQLTWKLWKYLTDRFSTLGKHLKQSDAEVYKHITIPLSTYAYKVICNNADVQELYDENPKDKKYPGIYTMNPRRMKNHGPVAHLKWNKLYAHIIMQYNLMQYDCACCGTNEGKYHGKNIYDVKGFYCIKQHGIVEKYLKELLTKSKTDPDASFITDIVCDNINSIITHAVYYSMYNPNAAYDCYSIARQQSVAMLYKFADAGYYVIYVEGDDVFIQLDPAKGQTYDSLLKVKDDVIAFLKTRMPYPSPTFDMELVEDIRYLRFFGNGPVTSVFLRKGQYAYVTQTGKVVSKGVTESELNQVLAEVS